MSSGLEIPGMPGRRSLRVLACFTAMLVAAACEDEPPPESIDIGPFVGIWEMGRLGESDPYAYLQISSDGRIAYARNDSTGMGHSCMTIDEAEIGHITETEISVPILLGMSADFEINAFPEPVAGDMRMTVDGDVLYRTGIAADSFRYEWFCEDGDFGRQPR